MASSCTGSWTGRVGFGAASATAGTPTRAADDATARAAARERRDLRKGVLQRTCGNRPPCEAVSSTFVFREPGSVGHAVQPTGDEASLFPGSKPRVSDEP